MKIILNDEFSIITDPYNNILVRTKKNDTTRKSTKKEERDVPVAYCTTVELTLARFLKEVQKKATSDIDGHIEEYYDAICKVNQETLEEMTKLVKAVTDDVK